MLGLYVTKVTLFSERSFKEQYSYSIYPGYSFHDVMQSIEEDYGADNIVAINITPISYPDEGPSVEISKSLAEVFVHDCPRLIEVPHTALYQKKEEDYID